MGLFPGDFRADAFYFFVHLGNIFMQLLDRDRIQVPFGFWHVFRQIVVFLHPGFSSVNSPLTGLASVPPRR